jgi:DNA repair protein RecO (recombination protein O)
LSGPRRAAAGPLEAYVLHRYDWSETSLILDLFTRERGRIAVAAKGAKRPYSQLRPVLLPFQRIHVTLARHAADEHAEVHTLRGAEWAGGAPMLEGAALFAGFHCNELLMRLLARGDPHAALFDAYAATLPALAAGDETLAQAALRAFELALLREAGVLPDLAHVTATLESVQDGARYRLLADGGVVRAAPADAATLDGAGLRALQAALDDGGQRALQQAVLPALVPLRAMLRALLHYHAGVPALRTRQVVQGLQQLLDHRSPA